jgi:hypothetical protein
MIKGHRSLPLTACIGILSYEKERERQREREREMERAVLLAYLDI